MTERPPAERLARRRLQEEVTITRDWSGAMGQVAQIALHDAWVLLHALDAARATNERLTADAATAVRLCNETARQRDEALSALSQAEAALAFYGEQGNYSVYDGRPKGNDNSGRRAREALAAIRRLRENTKGEVGE